MTPWTLPDLGENINKATVLRVLVAAGDRITATQPVLEVETDKVNVEVPAGVDGTIGEILVKTGDVIKPGATVFQLADGGAAPAVSREPVVTQTIEAPAAVKQIDEPVGARRAVPLPVPPTPSPTPRAPVSTDTINAAPIVRKAARELGLALSEIPASGPNGMLLHDDVVAYARQLIEHARGGTSASGAAPTALPDFTKFGAVTREPMSGMRTTTAERLAQAWTTIPHVTQFDHADITAIEALRGHVGHTVEASGGKLTMTVLLLRAVTSALQQFRQFNASIDLASHEIIYKQFYNIGIAVDTPQGLVVPVVRDIANKSLTALAQELPALAAKARDKKLTRDDVQGGTFTISNLGGIGGTNFTPIINPPEVAILAVSRGEWTQARRGTKWVPILRLPLGLSYDHRLIDGADAARFLRAIVAQLEDPSWVAAEFASKPARTAKKTPAKKKTPTRTKGRRK